MPKKAKKTPARELPPDIKAADLKWGTGLGYERRKALADELGLEDLPYGLEFYKIESFGWVLVTLGIRRAGKRASNNSARTYAVKVSDGEVCRVGHGPHVKDKLTVYVADENLDRLMPYLKLYVKGLSAAGQIRDRISTRRARTALRRNLFDSPW